MATWKWFSQLYFQGSPVAFLWNIYPDIGKFKDENFTNSEDATKSTEFMCLENYRLYIIWQQSMTSLCHMITWHHMIYGRVNEDHSTLCTSLRKVWSSIATCLQARYTGNFSSELLTLLSPLLVCHCYPPPPPPPSLLWYTPIGADAIIERQRSS